MRSLILGILMLLSTSAFAEFKCMNSTECFVLAEGIYFEARGEALQGKVAVAWTIRNRVERPYFPNTYVGVLNGDDCAFSYWCDGNPEYIDDLTAWEVCLLVAAQVYKGLIDDPTDGADHYYNPATITKKRLWMRKYKETARIGNHVFLKRNH